MRRVTLYHFRMLPVALVAGFAAMAAQPQALVPDIAVTKIINAPIAEVWKAWTTAEGIESFFAPKAKVEPVPGGAFELWFGLNNPEGSQGSEGCRVHSVKPMEQFVFEWNAPPENPTIRRCAPWSISISRRCPTIGRR